MKPKNLAAPARGLPPKQGLYDPANERDACGIGFVAHIKNRKSRDIIDKGLLILANLAHRGAVGADPKAGDGCGILLQMPHQFLVARAGEAGFDLPGEGMYGAGNIFLPRDKPRRQKCIDLIERIIGEEGQALLGWRDIPVDNSDLGETVRPTEPFHAQLFIGRASNIDSVDAFERKLLVIRKRVFNELWKEHPTLVEDFYIPSLSSRTLLYKGMVLADQLGPYYLDLQDRDMVSGLALVHQRFSTNTFPTWRLAQPFRMVCHNGEINTVRGNVNWIKARFATMKSEVLGEDIKNIWPIVVDSQSDSASFDCVLELLVQCGYSLAHAMTTLIPEAWAGNPLMSPDLKAFYQYHAALMEPWDGPAAIAFSDGRQIGAMLDRNGLRPARYLITNDDLVVLSSETGVLPIDEASIVAKKRLRPGSMLLIDLEKGSIVSNAELKSQMASAYPYQDWLDNTQIVLEEMDDVYAPPRRSNVSLLDMQQAFGYTQEDLKILLSPMAATGQEALGSMGTDTPLSALSQRSKLLPTYFKQLFAQVTNPPIDPIREESVMSLVSFIGPRPNLLDPTSTASLKRLEVRQPILKDADLEKIRAIGEISDNYFQTITLDITFGQTRGPEGLGPAVERICERAEKAVGDGYNIIILSDRLTGPDRVPVPALLATSAVHHHLIKVGLRTSVGLVVETGEAREVHHFCTLAGFGAEAINPYLAFETVDELRHSLSKNVTRRQAIHRYIKAIDKGILKVMSKMGISTYQSYCGAQIFDAVGLSSQFIEAYFAGTRTAVEGVGLGEVATETFLRHATAFSDAPLFRDALDVGGEYALRVRGETHIWNAAAISDLQHAVRGPMPEKYRDFARHINEQSGSGATLRGLFRLREPEEMGLTPVPLDEVEPASDIVRRFSTGAMSFGSISREAHTNLAIAMNSIGAKSNTGEGGEQPDRFTPRPDGTSMRSAIKQVASGRFGVTAEYLVNADQIQIKIAQGAKPGEGGQLPGHKVDAVIAKVRCSTPGVGLISPPPHHDIYSIEDLAQLIFDLKNVNQDADISVKLVSEIGVGTVAAGVAKARADHITISGFDGGTGASPLTSIKHAGSPWEIGLAETQQTLVLNRLRGRVALQVDGGLKTGRDVIIGALLGADEFGFATAPLVASGCIMMRKCHLNTCPVGVATQDPVLRKRFVGKPEHVVNYFFYVAEELREIMAEMGVRKLDEIIGQTAWLDQAEAIDHFKARGLDFSALFAAQGATGDIPARHTERQHHLIEKVLDRRFISDAADAIKTGKPVQLAYDIFNTDRTAGAMLSGEIAKQHGHKGLKPETISINLTGNAGQSFGAFLARGVTLSLKGDANDYVGKGLSGGRLVIRPDERSTISAPDSIIIGNTALYGAINGEVYISGQAGERFAVRNSGAVAVVEGTGDHGCEYMTGGVVVVIGQTGRNFAAGMSGGIAYVLDEAGDFAARCNLTMVDLEPVEAEDDLMELLHHTGGDLESHGRVDVLKAMSGHDAERLALMITAHQEATGSQRARAILDNWDDYLPKFVKIMPVEYRRALQEIERVQASAPALVAGE